MARATLIVADTRYELVGRTAQIVALIAARASRLNGTDYGKVEVNFSPQSVKLWFTESVERKVTDE